VKLVIGVSQATLAGRMARAALVCTVLALLALAPAARAQDNPFGPLPAAPTPVATATPTATASNTTNSSETGTRTLLLIGAGLLIAFLAMGFFIARDARRSLPEDKRPTNALRDEQAHAHKRQAKARARAKTRAQKAARRRNRPV
jgi:hypothetical protein